MKLLLYFLLITLVGRNEGNNYFPHFRKLKSRSTASVQTAAAQDLVRRLIPDRADEFNIQVDPYLAEGDKDVFTFVTDKATGKMNITGNAGVVATWGFYHFLKFHCGCHVSWGGQQLNIPKPLPVIEAPGYKMISNDQFRYYENVCTVSYSFVWYNWTDWERQIDWMALNGINLPLAFNGQEAIMQRVFTNMNFTQKDLDDFFTGPAFLAWFRMGNIQKWGGPLPQSWINDQLVLQHRILRRMRSLGMVPVLAGFGGHVPANIKKLYPNVSVSTLTNWSQFKPPYTGTTIINFDDPLFAEVGRRFIEETIKELGTNHVYATDLFNEMRPKSSNITYLKMSGAAIYKGMVSADPDAVWVMQGWLFQDSSFWKLPQAKALLTSVPMGRMIVLDLFAEIRPLWQKFDSFFGQPFVWCMLHNYGGTMDLYGDIESVNVGPSKARSYPNSSMIGIGISPEGINQNYVMYEFMLDQGIGPGPKNIAEWISGYAKRRYGVENHYIDKGWQLLRGSVYSCNETIHDGHGNVVFTGRPHLNMKEAIWYDTENLFYAWDFFIFASNIVNTTLFRYDLVDVTRNCLEIMSQYYYKQIINGYKRKDIMLLTKASHKLLSLLNDLDTLLASDSHFLLGNWLEAAKRLGYTDQEKKLYEYNARNQITLWGPNGEIADYASKQWAGLIKHYYYPRWNIFTKMLLNSLYTGIPYSQEDFDYKVFYEVEQPFTFDISIFPTQPEGDTIYLAQEMFWKYRDVANLIFSKELPVYSNRINKWKNLVNTF